MARTTINTSVKRYATLGGRPIQCVMAADGLWLQQGGSAIHLFPSEHEDLCQLVKDTIDAAMREWPLEREDD